MCSDIDEEDGNGYDEGLGDSLSSLGFTKLKMNDKVGTQKVGTQNVSGSASRTSCDSGAGTDRWSVDNCIGIMPSLSQHPMPASVTPPIRIQSTQPQQPQQPQRQYPVAPFRSASFPEYRPQQRQSERATTPTPAAYTHSNSNYRGAPASSVNPQTHQTHDANGQKIKRPLNAYMLWLKSVRKNCPKTPMGKSGLTHEAEKCAGLGEQWKRLDDNEKAMWFERAAEAKKQHQRDYPNWKYTPRSPKTSKKAQKRATALASRCSSPAGKFQPFQRNSRRSLVGLSFSDFEQDDCGNSSSSSCFRSIDNSHQCDGLLEPLTPFFMQSQGESAMQTFQAFAALPAKGVAEVDSMIISGANCFAGNDMNDLLCMLS